MLSRTRSSALILALAAPLALVACSVDPGGEDFTKDEARLLGGVDDQGNDICALQGWYADDACDDFCVEPDPDCPVSNCPDPNDPTVTYHGEPGSSVCAQEIDFCAPDGVMFNSPECGCGCVEPDPGDACGGIAGIACDDGEFCNYAVETMCGAGDQMGVCQDIPEACPEYYAPVCGCDGTTYSNECFANGAGAAVLHAGACEGEFCGGIAGIPCGEGEFCNMDGQCDIADAGGVCEPLPEACPEIYSPVCSCDGTTYGNACEAHAAGASIAHDGECDAADQCGGIAGLVCPDGEFCNYTIEDVCGGGDQLGTCEVIPQGCPEFYDPVCGCDGVTYGNECEANANGVAIVSNDPCE